MNAFFLVYDPTFEEWLILFGGVFMVFLVAFLVTRFTKYGGGNNYGMIGEFDDDFTDYHDDFD